MKLFKWLRRQVHLCKPVQYDGQDVVFHWEIPWLFHQEFTVCRECNCVSVISETRDVGCFPFGGPQREQHGKEWSGRCHYGKVPSIGRDKLKLK